MYAEGTCRKNVLCLPNRRDLFTHVNVTASCVCVSLRCIPSDKVMMIQNIAVDQRFANGTQGRLLHWHPSATQSKGKALPAYCQELSGRFCKESALSKKELMPGGCSYFFCLPQCVRDLGTEHASVSVNDYYSYYYTSVKTAQQHEKICDQTLTSWISEPGKKPCMQRASR